MEDRREQVKTEDRSFPIALVEMIIRWRKFLLWAVIISLGSSLIAAFVMPRQYRSSASVFPAESADLFGSMDGISSLVKSFSPAKGLAGFGMNGELDRYMAILNSGRVLGSVINKFDLINVYDITSYPMEKTTKELLSNVEFTIEPEQYISITVFDEDSNRAAEMANFFVEELNRINSELHAQNAKANRGFIGDRYQKNLTDLTRAEDSLKAFQKKFGVIAMPDQIEASIKAGAELTAQIALKEVQLSVQERELSNENPLVVATKIEIDEMKKKISQLNRTSTASRNDMNLLVPFARIPDIGTEYIRRYRDVEIQYKILQFITPLFEQAKVEEQRQTPSVIVLDRASPAERKSKPKRVFIVLTGSLIGIVISFGYCVYHDWWLEEKKKKSPLYKSVDTLTHAIKSDIHSLGNKEG